jgi:hypothetical protein
LVKPWLFVHGRSAQRDREFHTHPHVVRLVSVGEKRPTLSSTKTPRRTEAPTARVALSRSLLSPRAVRHSAMHSILLVGASVIAVSAQSSCTNKEWGQCGGKQWTGPTCCPSYDTCKKVNDYYSQCMPHGICLNPMYSQCGGYDHHQPPRPWTPANHHSTCCPPSFDCKFQTKYYSQCVFNATNSSCASEYQQCGGQGWKGPTCCIPGFKCTPDSKSPQYYSREYSWPSLRCENASSRCALYICPRTLAAAAPDLSPHCHLSQPGPYRAPSLHRVQATSHLHQRTLRPVRWN